MPKKLKPKKVLGNYFDPARRIHVCRFCAISIRNEKFQPGANFAQAILTMDDGSQFSFNCCADCLRRVDLKDQDTLDAIQQSTVEALVIENGGKENSQIKRFKEKKVNKGKRPTILRGKR